MGVIHLKDIVKGGMKERIAQLRKMGIRGSIMITGDNPLTAAATPPKPASTISGASHAQGHSRIHQEGASAAGWSP